MGHRHAGTYSTKIAVLKPYARAPARLASCAITWITRAFDLTFSAASTLRSHAGQQHISAKSVVHTHGNSDATSGLSTGSEWLIWLMYRCMGRNTAGIALTEFVARFVVAVRSGPVVVGCVSHVAVTRSMESVEVASSMI
jgi:hypothetical protein